MSVDIQNYIYNLSRELNIENTEGVFGNELELIAIVRNCPFIYDKSRIDFRDIQKKEITWEAIASIMHSSVGDCKARWKSLREQYAKIKKTVRDDDSKIVQWEFMEDMKFLDDHIKPRRIKQKYRTGYLNTNQQSIEHDEEYRIEWLDDGKHYDSREIKLIHLVKSCPLLYNKNNFDHKDSLKKEQAWMSISKILGMPALDCKTRWKTMRERYSRERKCQIEEPNRKPWLYYEEMSFLDSHVRARRSSSRSLLPKADFTAFVESNSAHPENAPPFQVQKMEFIDPSISPNSNSISDVPLGEKIDNLVSHVVDEDDLFGQSIAAELKRITGRRKKMMLKANIFKLLCEAESDSN